MRVVFFTLRKCAIEVQTIEQEEKRRHDRKEQSTDIYKKSRRKNFSRVGPLVEKLSRSNFFPVFPFLLLLITDGNKCHERIHFYGKVQK